MAHPTRTSPGPVAGGDGSGGKVSTGQIIIPSVTIPEGWHNSPRDLARHSYFSRGEGICGLLEEHGFHYVYPVMMDDFNTYLIRTKKLGATTLTYFVWYPIVGTIFLVKGDDLQKIVNTMGRSILALDMVELGDAVGGELPPPVRPGPGSPVGEVPPPVKPGRTDPPGVELPPPSRPDGERGR